MPYRAVVVGTFITTLEPEAEQDKLSQLTYPPWIEQDVSVPYLIDTSDGKDILTEPPLGRPWGNTPDNDNLVKVFPTTEGSHATDVPVISPPNNIYDRIAYIMQRPAIE